MILILVLLIWFMFVSAGIGAMFKSSSLRKFIGWVIGTTVLCSLLGGFGFIIAIVWGLVWSHKSNKHNESTK